jgi:hypothetical protein
MNFLERFSEKIQISGLMKFRSVGAELLHADGQKDRHRHDEANRGFPKFCDRASNLHNIHATYVYLN